MEFEPVPDKPEYSQLIDKDTPEEKEHNSKIYERSREIEIEMWKEIWQIFKGQDYEEFKGNQEDWNKFFDGSNCKLWWD